jgi:hypothetical protein
MEQKSRTTLKELAFCFLLFDCLTVFLSNRSFVKQSVMSDTSDMKGFKMQVKNNAMCTNK